MPELLEIEYYRRAAEQVVGRRVVAVVAPDDWYLKGAVAEDLTELVGDTVVAARRRGKLLVLDTRGGPTLGLRFGMTGTLVVDGVPAIDRLQYGGARTDEAWDRFSLQFADGGDLRMSDPRRLGGVSLDPDESSLGPDALSIAPAQLRRAISTSSAPLKARLLDQVQVAGIGNLLADEILWRAGLDPGRPARSLDPVEQRRLHRHLRSTLDDLLARGGSHTGDLMPARRPGGTCPRDGAALQRRTIGGRTTWSCPHHQR